MAYVSVMRPWVCFASLAMTGGIDSLLLRINSLLARIKFAVGANLTPCSVAQGIHLVRSRKGLNLQLFSGRIFATSDGFSRDSLLIPC
jgi:hypothetical protein